MTDQDRVRAEYARRAVRPELQNAYSLFNPAHLYMIQSRQRDTLRLLKQVGVTSLAGKRILEVGCGNGGVLAEYLSYEANPQLIYGIELLPDRLQMAYTRNPAIGVAVADGSQLPFPTARIDVALQYTVFSSVLEHDLKEQIASEMIRVVKPGGVIIWYDFWLNPTNPQTHGVRLAEVRRLFPGCQLTVHRITLAPPLTRRLIRFGSLFCTLLEFTRLLNTHLLIGIRR